MHGMVSVCLQNNNTTRTLINPPQVRARVSWPALLNVLAVMLVMTAAYKLFMLAASFLKLRAPCRTRHDMQIDIIHQHKRQGGGDDAHFID